MPAAKPTLTYEDFLRDVSPFQRPDVDELHALLTAQGCKVKVQPAKNGSVVSYLAPGNTKTLVNLVFRKQGVTARLYADHVGTYEEALTALPDALQNQVEKAGSCRRLLDPTKCSPTCQMGNIFTLNGTLHKKCRFNTFLFLLSEENTPHFLNLLTHELACRAGDVG